MCGSYIGHFTFSPSLGQKKWMRPSYVGTPLQRIVPVKKNIYSVLFSISNYHPSMPHNLFRVTLSTPILSSTCQQFTCAFVHCFLHVAFCPIAPNTNALPLTLCTCRLALDLACRTLPPHVHVHKVVELDIVWATHGCTRM